MGVTETKYCPCGTRSNRKFPALSVTAVFATEESFCRSRTVAASIAAPSLPLMVPVMGALWVCAAAGIVVRPVSSSMLARRARSVGCMVGFFQKLEIFCCGAAVFHRLRSIGYIKGGGGYGCFL